MIPCSRSPIIRTLRLYKTLGPGIDEKGSGDVHIIVYTQPG
jgi:hypothetical protein